MKVWIIYDPEDAQEFERQAFNCRDYYGADHTVDMLVLPEGSAMDKRWVLFRTMREIADRTYDRIMFFCHGARYNLNRKMISDQNWSTFGLYLDRIATSGGTVIFWSCNTAIDDDGFAATMALISDCDVIGHAETGHTTCNPFKTLFVGGAAKRFDLWKTRGGVDALYDRFWSDVNEPFIFVEEVLA